MGKQIVEVLILMHGYFDAKHYMSRLVGVY